LAAKSGPQKPVNILFKVRALYDFNPSENGELKLQKGQILDVTDNSTFADWWKGTSNGQTGIFPSNYVSKIEDGRVIHRSIPDENAEILQHMKIINDLKAAIMKADPLGHNSLENERLQVLKRS
jgi:signal transducing adaptor molecule